MDNYLQNLIRQHATDPSKIIDIRRSFLRAQLPLPPHILYDYVFEALKMSLRQQLDNFIEQLLNTEGVIPDRFAGAGSEDGFFYEGWYGSFKSNQPRTKHLPYSEESRRYGYIPEFQWALMCSDSVDPDEPRTTRRFGELGGGQIFGDLNMLCQELQQNLVDITGCNLWEVDWSHGQNIEEYTYPLTEDEYQMRINNGVMNNTFEQWILNQTGEHISHQSTVHGFFIWIKHPIDNHILDMVEMQTVPKKFYSKNPNTPSERCEICWSYGCDCSPEYKQWLQDISDLLYTAIQMKRDELPADYMWADAYEAGFDPRETINILIGPLNDPDELKRAIYLEGSGLGGAARHFKWSNQELSDTIEEILRHELDDIDEYDEPD